MNFRIPSIDFRYLFTENKVFRFTWRAVLAAVIVLAIIAIIVREEPGKIMSDSDLKLAAYRGEIRSLQKERLGFNDQKKALLEEIKKIKDNLHSVPVPGTAQIIPTAKIGEREYVSMDEYIDLFNAKTYSSEIVQKYEEYIALDTHSEDNHTAMEQAYQDAIDELKADRDRLYNIATRRWSLSVGLVGGWGLNGPFLGIGGGLVYRIK